MHALRFVASIQLCAYAIQKHVMNRLSKATRNNSKSPTAIPSFNNTVIPSYH